MAEDAARPGRNGYDPDKVKGYYNELQRCDDELESLRGKYMADCKAVREDIKDIYTTAKDADDIPKKVLKGVIDEQKLLKKAEAIRDDMDDLQDDFDVIKHSLGLLEDTPLGQAALDRAAANGSGAEATA